MYASEKLEYIMYADRQSLSKEEVGRYVYSCPCPSLLLLRLLSDEALVDIGDHTCRGQKEKGLHGKHL